VSRADEIRDLLCSDDAADHARAGELAGTDAALRAVLDEHARLARDIATWKTQAPPPPAELRARIVAGIANAPTSNEAAESTVVPATRRFRAGIWSWQGVLAAVATIVVVVFVTRGAFTEPPVISTSGRLLVTEALTAAHEAEQRHAAAIALLQDIAAPILKRADDPRTDAAQASLLLAYRDRLSAIDTAIAEVNSYLDENPGLASARTVLLAAYIDKTRILEEVLEREDRGELG
jgi:hypothetical protein